jgi:hypothetical protein
MEELNAMAPTARDMILPPGVNTAVKMAENYGRNAIQGIKEGSQDVSEAAHNIAQGGPVGANLGKAGSGVLHAGLQATPFIGPPIETAGKDIAQHNYAGAAGGLTGVVGQLAAPEIFKEAPKEAPSSGPGLLRAKSGNLIREMTGTTPERISELQDIPEKVADIHQLAVKTEASARAAAKAAYPEINTPVKIGPPVAEAEPFDPTATIGAKQETIPFKDAQERYSQLGIDARAAHRARMQGLITGFDEAAILREKQALGDAMQDAAESSGKLDEYNSAQRQFRQFMNDFHNRGSAVEPLLEMNPADSNKIVGHFLNPDRGPRAIEVMKSYGADTTPVTDLLSKGATPLKIDVAEAAKLRKVGPEAYGLQRLQESIDQAQFNRMPSSAQARLPAWAMRKKSDIPLVPEALQPNIPTRFLVSKLLKTDLAKNAVSSGAPEATRTLNAPVGPLGVSVGKVPPGAIPQIESTPPSIVPNASGESSASMEAINRASSERRANVSRVKIDTRSGKETPLIGTDAVDAKAGPYERIVKRQPGKPDQVLDQGEKAKPIKFRQNLNETESMADPDTRFNTARHEAGHAVISELLRPNSVQGLGLDESGGYTLASPPMGKTSTKQLNPDEIRNLVAVSYAGGMSEPGGTTAKHVGPDQARRADILSGSATTPLSNFARILTGHTFGQDQFLQANEQQAEAKARVNALLADPKTRSMIDSLATMLNVKGTMSGPEVRAFLATGGK